MQEEEKKQQTVPVVAVVLAAGFGTRFDPENPKQLVCIADKPIVCWSIEAFERNSRKGSSMKPGTARCVW